MTTEVGRPIDATYPAEVLRAELVEAINQYCFDHSPKIADALLDRFNVSRKPLREKRYGS